MHLFKDTNALTMKHDATNDSQPSELVVKEMPNWPLLSFNLVSSNCSQLQLTCWYWVTSVQRSQTVCNSTSNDVLSCIGRSFWSLPTLLGHAAVSN